MRIIATLICLALLVSCKEQNQSQDDKDTLDTTAFSENIESTDEEVILVPEAREQALQWVTYITAQNEINNLKEATVNDVIENAVPLAQIMQSLQNSVPDSLSSKAVQARLNVLATKAQILEQLSSQRNPKAAEIAQTAGEIPEEFNNFKLQLNEIFLKSLEDFESELDEFQREEEQSQNDTL